MPRFSSLEPDGNDDITFTLVANVACASGGICSGTGTPITQVPSAHTIPVRQTATTGELSVADAAASEEDDSTIDFVVTLSPAGDESVTVDYATANGSAAAGNDYTAKSGSLTFNAGETSKTIQVAIIDDTVDDDNETLTVTLSNASGAEISDGQATGTITDGDTETSPLTAEFQDLPDSHDSSTAFTFQVRFSEDVGISYVNMRDDTFSLDDGDVTGARRVDGRHDLWEITVEPDDNSDVVITLPANRACTTAGAICTREDSPRQLTNSPSATVPGPTDQSSSDTTEEPTVTSQLAVANATASEEDNSTIDFVVTLNPAGEANITVDYATANGTASAGSDYTAQSGTLTFTAGETSKTVTVAIIDDSAEESDETLTLTLSNPSGAEISDGQATGTITDSEPVPLTASFSNMPDSHDGSTEFTFDLTFSENLELSYRDAARPCLHKRRAKRRPHRRRPAQGAGQQPDLDHYGRSHQTTAPSPSRCRKPPTATPPAPSAPTTAASFQIQTRSRSLDRSKRQQPCHTHARPQNPRGKSTIRLPESRRQ